MSKIVLRILVSTQTELKYVAMNCLESRNLVDKVLVVEHNFTHTGKPKPFYFESEAKNEIEILSGNKTVEILHVDLSESIIRNATNSNDVHINEHLMRVSFLKNFQIDKRDLIISVDADEIIFRNTYRLLFLANRVLPLMRIHVALMMHQFFYKPNYLWRGLRFRSAVAVNGEVLISNPKNIRDSGFLFPAWSGCHFSWQLEPKEMVEKIQNYAHNPEYAHLADESVLRDAVKSRTYPFDPNRKFPIKQLSRKQAYRYFPKSYWIMETKFSSYLRDWSY